MTLSHEKRLAFLEALEHPVFTALGAKTVNIAQVTVAHGLGYTPTMISVLMNSAGTVWRSAASDATNIYLKADADGRTCEVFVR
jgi:hypothetical protein